MKDEMRKTKCEIRKEGIYAEDAESTEGTESSVMVDAGLVAR